MKKTDALTLDMTLDGEGLLWQQIRRAIARPILSGTLPPGTRIPAEDDLMKLTGAAKMTVHKAIRSLAVDGLVERKPKLGTIVALRSTEQPVFEILDVAAHIGQASGQYGYRSRSITIQNATVEQASLLKTTPGAPLIVVICVHFSGEAVFQVEERLVNRTAVAVKPALFQKTPPSRWLVDHVPWTEAEHTISARPARGEIAELLGVRAGTACLVIERRTWNVDVPITYARLWHAGDQHKLFGRFKPPSL